MADLTAQQRWFALVEECERSGQSTADFCNARGLNLKTLTWYRSRWRAQQPKDLPVPAQPDFVAFTMVHAPKPQPQPLRLRLDHRPFVLELPKGTDLDWLSTVLEALC